MARFNLPQKVPNSCANLEFYAWYVIANLVLGYNINSTCIKKIKAMFQANKGSKSTHLNFFRLSSRLIQQGLLDMEKSWLRSLIKGAHRGL